MYGNLKDLIWERDKGVCQECGRKLAETHYTPDPGDVAEKRLAEIKEIPVLIFSWECWNCGKNTPVASYYFTTIYPQGIGMVEKMAKILVDKYPFVQRIQTKSLGEVVTNVCVHCGKVRGNSYVNSELQRLMWNGERQDLIDMKLPNNLTISDLEIPSVNPHRYEKKTVRWRGSS